MLSRILGIIILLMVFYSIFEEYALYTILVVIGIIVLLFIIRWIADIFWWGKNKNHW